MLTITNQSGINTVLAGTNGAPDNSIYFNTDTKQLCISEGTGSMIAFPADIGTKNNLVEEEMMNALGAKHYWNANKILGTGTYTTKPTFSRVGGTGLVTADQWGDNTGGNDRYISAFYPCAGTGDDGMYLKQDTYASQGTISFGSLSRAYNTQASVYMSYYDDHLNFSPSLSLNQPCSFVILCKPTDTQWGMLRFGTNKGFGAEYSDGNPLINSTSYSNTTHTANASWFHGGQLWILNISGGTTPHIRMRINGVETHNYNVDDGGPAMPDPITATELFSNAQNSAWGGEGHLYEFAIFEGKILNMKEINALESFYSNKYNFSTGMLKLMS